MPTTSAPASARIASRSWSRPTHVLLLMAAALPACFDPQQLGLDSVGEDESTGSTGEAPSSDGAESSTDDVPGTTVGNSTGPDEPVGECGDGIVDDGELCDGADLDGKLCGSLGFGGGTLACANDCTFDVSQCDGCGNGVLDGAEVCDGTELDGGSSCADVGLGLRTEALQCTQWCTLDFAECSACGDGSVMAPEVCELGNLGGATCASEGYDGGTLSCTQGCAFDFGGCQQCGNGTIEGDEVCDGNDIVQDCDDVGFGTGILQCAADCTYDASACTTCGDGVRNGSEACDGDDLDDATCSSQGFASGSISCASDCTFDVDACEGAGCGDGVVNLGEECDGSVQLTCENLIGWPNGTPSCTSECFIDSSDCWGCGDGITQGSEDCDGSADATCEALVGMDSGDVGCTAACVFDTSGCSNAPVRRVFVTSGQFNANFGGALGGDAICQAVADDAGLDGTFRAWLSDATTTPLARFTHSVDPYQLVNGTTIADNWNDLVDGQLDAAIGITETGQAVNAAATWVATATTASGTRQMFNGDCQSWISATDGFSAGVGNEENTVSWSDSGAIPCNWLVSLYCFEQ